MSLATGTSLKPRPYFCSATDAVVTNASLTPTTISFQPSYSGGVITESGLTQVSIAQWNALQLSNFQVKGVGDGAVPVIYELKSFGGGSSSVPSTLQYYATPLTATAVTTSAYIISNV